MSTDACNIYQTSVQDQGCYFDDSLTDLVSEVTNWMEYLKSYRAQGPCIAKIAEDLLVHNCVKYTLHIVKAYFHVTENGGYVLCSDSLCPRVPAAFFSLKQLDLQNILWPQ